jgi:hypothetical protein
MNPAAAARHNQTQPKEHNMTRPIRAAVLGLALTLGTAGLAACTGGGSAATASSSTAPSASGSASASAARGFGGGVFASAKVQACLKAAGITVPTGGRAGGFPSGSRPSGSFPSGSRPSFPRPSGSRPSGAGGGFGGNSAESQKIQAALKACGITLPTGGNRTGTSASTPSASPTA